jgi:phage-related protein
MQSVFTDPTTAETYVWPVNHSEESDSTGKSRSISYGGNTGQTGLVAQQGDTQPLEFHLHGSILEEAQYEAFIDWYNRCEDRTIFWTDPAGDQYEVQITDYKPVRKRTIKNPRGGSKAQYWFWEYEMVMRVLRVISGPWAGTVT